jgi:hypothetical protein
MKTVRPLGLVMLGCLIAFALSGCGSVFGRYVGTAVEFREDGKPATLSMSEYMAIRGELKTLLAERNLGLADVGFHAPMIAIVDVKTEFSTAGRTVKPLKIGKVLGNPKVRNLSPGMAGYWVNSSNEGTHPSLTLTSGFTGYDRGYTSPSSTR